MSSVALNTAPLKPNELRKQPITLPDEVDGILIQPVPEDVPKPQFMLKEWGKPESVYEYRNDDGALLCYIARYVRHSQTGREKHFMPFTCYRMADGNYRWKRKMLPPKRPLYGLEILAANEQANVIITEGEKACEAARKLFPQHVVMCSPGGSNAVKQIDWSPLQYRRVIIWPDADDAGEKYALEVKQALLNIGANGVGILAVPDQVKAGWDAADAMDEEWSDTELSKLIETATVCSPIRKSSDDLKNGITEESLNQKQQLLAICSSIELFHDAAGEAYATIERDAHYETMSLRTRFFNQWVKYRFFEETGNAPSNQTLTEVFGVLESRALFTGKEHKVFMRSGILNDEMYIDLGSPDWKFVKITKDGWELIHSKDTKFIRTANMEPLPTPQKGASLDALYPFVNVESYDDFRLLLAWILASLRPEGESPYPILILQGEQGTGKSILSTILRNFTDPSTTALRAMPTNERDIVISARNNHVMAYDNLSGLSNSLSDCLCRISTGGGFGSRALYTDMEESLINVTRPIILNGIDDIASRPDLAERSIILNLPQVPESKRQDIKSLFNELQKLKSGIFGAVLDAISTALCNLPYTKLPHKPRMADFALWISAAEQALGWKSGEFLASFAANQQATVESAFDKEPLVLAITELLTEQGSYEGLVKALYESLDRFQPDWETGRYSKWPKNPAALGRDLKRLAPVFRKLGISIEKGKRQGNGQPYLIRKLTQEPA